MWIKDDVRLDNLAPQMVVAIIVVADCFEEMNADATITSGSEGEHARLTYHRNGNALDWRTARLTQKARQLLAQMVRSRLGPNYAVILEDAPPHMHVHYNPAPSAPITPA